jgi:hypothetical protein
MSRLHVLQVDNVSSFESRTSVDSDVITDSSLLVSQKSRVSSRSSVNLSTVSNVYQLRLPSQRDDSDRLYFNIPEDVRRVNFRNVGCIVHECLQILQMIDPTAWPGSGETPVELTGPVALTALPRASRLAWSGMQMNGCVHNI